MPRAAVVRMLIAALGMQWSLILDSLVRQAWSFEKSWILWPRKFSKRHGRCSRPKKPPANHGGLACFSYGFQYHGSLLRRFVCMCRHRWILISRPDGLQSRSSRCNSLSVYFRLVLLDAHRVYLIISDHKATKKWDFAMNLQPLLFQNTERH